jgi:hypothetical protein
MESVEGRRPMDVAQLSLPIRPLGLDRIPMVEALMLCHAFLVGCQCSIHCLVLE